MNHPRITQLFIFLGVLFIGYACYALVMMNDKSLLGWNVLYASIFVATLFCAWGLSKSKPWALWLSLGLALAALGLGCDLAHFAWTFWIFEEPTLPKRILAVIHPRLSIFLIFPVAWLIYFTRLSFRHGRDG